MKNLASFKNISSNLLFSKFFSTNVTFTKFLQKMCDTMWDLNLYRENDSGV